MGKIKDAKPVEVRFSVFFNPELNLRLCSIVNGRFIF